MTTQAGHPGGDQDVYTQDFIDDAVLRVIEGRRARGEAYRSLRAVCRELDVPKTTLLRWVRRAEDQAAGTFFGPTAADEPGHDCDLRPRVAGRLLMVASGTAHDGGACGWAPSAVRRRSYPLVVAPARSLRYRPGRAEREVIRVGNSGEQHTGSRPDPPVTLDLALELAVPAVPVLRQARLTR
jgi:transposase-like protein